MEIIDMSCVHLDAVAELEKVCFSAPWSREALASELENELSLWLIAMEDGVVLGYAGTQSVQGEADMMNIAVAPQARRKGVARALMDMLVQRLESRGVHSLSLEVRASNEPAVLLYKKLGFVQVGLRPGYYHKPREDALILKKEW